MKKDIYTGVAVLSVLLLRARAQLLSCADVGCPKNAYASECTVDGTELTEVGVANFSSALSSKPLTWTIGYAPGIRSNIPNTTDSRNYYLGVPQGVDLENRTDIIGCALFFTGIERGLIVTGLASTACEDVLGSKCVPDLTSQARNLVAASSNFQCSDIAQSLQSSPPASCTRTGTWGNITAKAITSSSLSLMKPGQSCTPTIDKTYDMYNVAATHQVGKEGIINLVTPIMTMFAATENSSSVLVSPEVHLNCMKPVEDRPRNQVTQKGRGVKLTVWSALPSVMVVVTGLMATSLLMV